MEERECGYTQRDWRRDLAIFAHTFYPQVIFKSMESTHTLIFFKVLPEEYDKMEINHSFNKGDMKWIKRYIF